MRNNKKAAVFLDRDGTIIEDQGHLQDPSEVVFFPETFEALQKLQKDYRLFIVTNQSGIAKGIISPDDVEKVNNHIMASLRERGIDIADIYVCPHKREDGCECIKPNPFFLKKAAAIHNIDLNRSFAIGDHPCDVELARGVGGQGVYILTGHGKRHKKELSHKVTVLPNIKAAADWIICKANTNLLHKAPSKIKQAVKLIREGGIVAFPTETVYGLGADALNQKAVARIFEIKKRPSFDPLIVHVATLQQMKQLVEDFPAKARQLTEQCWPGPLTIVLPKSEIVPDIVTAGLSTVAIRMPSHPMALELIRQADTPIAAPSANLFGSVSPTCAEHVREQLGKNVKFILDGGRCSVGVESTIISFAIDPPVVLRPGGITVEQIESVIGPLDIADLMDSRPLSPGRLPRHYAPGTPVVLHSKVRVSPENKRIGLLSLQPPRERKGFAAIETLSETGDLVEAATNLFAAMRRLDALGLDMIFAVTVPNKGVGRAINDRLCRASGEILDDNMVKIE
ncbi:MAG: threonylcarbamoyl-AMP synthase [Planctomycetes bacterium]|nr:threonylcarbamoyl-AMP synthase [Planctomycetota bacterium]